MEKIKNLIGGELVEPSSGHYLDNFAPSTGEVYSQLPDSQSEDIDRAVDSAKTGFKTWSSFSPQQRADFLFKLADLVDKNLEPLAEAESFDQGKPLWLAKEVDIPRASHNLRFFANMILTQRSVAFTDNQNKLEYVNHIPYGPCALISPWNLPLYLLTWKIAPCIAAGNTAICKPSELTPMTAFLFGKLTIEAGLPAGVINIVHGLGGQAGQALIEHPDVPVISFTGGTQTGSHIAKTVAGDFKKTSFELGGKNPNIIFADCDYDKALETTLRSSFLNQGEICLCGSRIFVEKTIYDRFLSDLVKKADALNVGDPKDNSNFLGALVSKDHLEKVQGYVTLAEQEGGRVHTKRKVENLPSQLKNGYFMRPTVISSLDYTCRVQQEEIFGPVVTITPFESEEEVLKMANSVKYGLASSLWTNDHSRIHRVSKQLQAGTVWVNTWMYRNLRVPLGGMKHSGVGREGGEYSLDFFTETQNVSLSY